MTCKHSREPVGVIILEGCAVELAEDETEFYAFKVSFKQIRIQQR